MPGVSNHGAWACRIIRSLSRKDYFLGQLLVMNRDPVAPLSCLSRTARHRTRQRKPKRLKGLYPFLSVCLVVLLIESNSRAKYVLLVITFYSCGSLHRANKTRQQDKTGKTPIAGGPAVARHTGAIVPAEASVVSRQRTWGTAGSMPEFAELPGWVVKSAKVTRDQSTSTNSLPPCAALVASGRATDGPDGIRTHGRSPTFTAY